jgi:serine phosphatase RsbU (regulator of sigma subunit)
MLDIAAVHHDLLLAALRDQDDVAVRDGVGARATAFFMESLSTYEMAQRGFREAQETARLEREHAHALHGLAEASVAINATRDPAALLELVTRSAREITGARCASIELQFDRRDGTRLSARSTAEDYDGPGDSVTISAPLIAPGGRRLGKLDLTDKAQGELSTNDDAIVTQLAQMVAVALENARLYEREHRIAHTLQQSLLPKRLPEIAGVELAARYLAAGEGNEVGGDFDDVVPLPGERWLVLIGDVCGKGPEAAAVTALARYSARAAAAPGRAPSAILRDLNRIMLDDVSRSEFCTIACGLLTRVAGGARLELALGGHPRPLLLHPDGRIAEAGEPGTLIGVVEDPALHDVEIPLEAGAAIVFYTDGVTDAAAPHRTWTAADVAAALQGAPPSDADAIASQLQQAVLDIGRRAPRDDIAILVASVAAPM